ncbi:MAG TPA: carboxypeptidase regulatory-like domain-containing protein [Bryocella sp.]|nr:carboxypeptidase regulatory-like domain-containing protein [Bryocella sp.]
MGLFRGQWRIWKWAACVFLVLAAQQFWAAEYHGRVRYDGVAVPGATVTLTQGSTELSTVTDSQGLYEFPRIAEGSWKIKIELRGFTPFNGNVTINSTNDQGEWTLQMLDLKALLSMAQQEPAATTPLNAREEKQPKKSAKDEKPEEPVPQAPQSNDDAERSADGLLINGSESNAATSQYSLSPAIGNHRPGTKALYNGSFGAYAENSIFDAKPYSLAGRVLPKDNYNRITMVATFGGPIRIPPLFYRGPNFFIAYQWTRNGSASIGTGLVPTDAERMGDLSGLPNAQQIYNPSTGAPLTCVDTGAAFDSTCAPGAPKASPQALALLALYPKSNINETTRYNYETSLLNDTHEDALQSRLDKTVSHRDSLYGTFSFQNIRANNESLFGFVDKTDTFGINTNVNWQHRFERQIFATVGYQFSRFRTQLLPQFAYADDISGDAGITGNDQDPREWGPPSLTFSSGIYPLTDGNSEFNRNRTDQISLRLSTTRGRHTILAGGDLRWQQYNQLQQQNPRGSFTFTGVGTTSSGSDLADFLLGLPETSALAYGNADKYFRQRAYDLYVNDDWRLRPELTINAGVRWEYGAPMTELKGRLVNLDLTRDFTAAAPVLGTSPKGPLTGERYPSSLVHGDLHGIEPRVALSWRPIPASTLVIRAGYGIYDDTSIYLAAAESMSQQAPLSSSLSVARSATCPLTLQKGFLNCPGSTPDTFAVDPNLRVGYAQVWQLSAQRDLPAALVMTATYLGTKGTHGTQEFLPNTYPIGATNPCPQCPTGFIYRTSGGNLERQAAQLQLRRRLRAGITATLDYTFAKAVDDDSSVGGQGHVAASSASAASSSTASSATPAGPPIVAQNWLNLRAERSLSSFDQRHLLNFIMQYTTGMGKGGGTLLSGWRGRAFKEWTVLAQVNAGSGLPETPIYISPVLGTGFANIMRPDRTSAPVYASANGYFLNWQAYAAPAAGHWGDTGRNSIRGPMTFTMNAALARTLRVRANDSLDIRIEADNLLNHASFTAWNTIWNPTTFGLPASVNAMRSVQLVGRFRF